MKRRCTSEDKVQRPSHYSSGQQTPGGVILPKDFLQKVIDLQSKQLQHFLYNRLREDANAFRCNRGGCREERPSHRSTLWHGKPLCRAKSMSAMSVYQQAQKRNEQLLHAKRKAMQQRSEAKEIYLRQLRHQKEAILRQKRKERLQRYEAHSKLKQRQESNERRRNKLLLRRLEEREGRILDFVNSKKESLEKAELIRRDMNLKKELLTSRIAELKAKGVNYSRILSLISTESQHSIRQISNRHTQARMETSIEKALEAYPRRSQALESEYFLEGPLRRKSKSPRKKFKTVNFIGEGDAESSVKHVAVSFDPRYLYQVE